MSGSKTNSVRGAGRRGTLNSGRDRGNNFNLRGGVGRDKGGNFGKENYFN